MLLKTENVHNKIIIVVYSMRLCMIINKNEEVEWKLDQKSTETTTPF